MGGGDCADPAVCNSLIRKGGGQLAVTNDWHAVHHAGYSPDKDCMCLQTS